MHSVLDSMVEVMDTEMPAQIARWGGNYNTWQNNLNNLRNWIDARCINMVGGMIDCYDLTGPYVQKITISPANSGLVRLNTEILPPFGGVRNVFGGIETIFEAIPTGNYQFSHWTFNNTVITDPTEILLMLDIEVNNDIVAHFIDLTETENQLIYYWHFNDFELLDETPTNAILADYQLFPTANATMTYAGGDPNMDPVNDGSMQNLQLGEEADKGARVRNPSLGRALVFNLPTTDLEDIVFLYSVKRTNSGQLINNVSYSIDGINFISAGLTETAFEITTEYQLVSLDFTEIATVNNNPNFHIRIEFEGNIDQANGNNRYDNISLTAKIIEEEEPGVSIDQYNQLEFVVYPNPTNHNMMVLSSEPIQEYKIFDLLGKTVVHSKNMNTVQFELFTKNFASGVYILEMKSAEHIIQTRIVKN
jgi:hypothetical protein